MKKITIIADNDTAGVVVVKTAYGSVELPVGIELTVDDFLAATITDKHTCLVGYYVADATAVASLPTTGIADGSYCMVMSTQTLKFLSGGAWV